MTESQEFHRVSDVALATVLTLEGHDHQDMEVDGDTVYWLFRNTPGVTGIVDLYAEKKCLVEPREYNALFAKMKGRMFALLDEDRKQRKIHSV